TPAVVSVDAEGLEDFGSEDFPRDSPAVEREEAPRPSGGQSHVVQGLEAQVALMSPSPVDGTAPLAYTATEVAPEFDDDAALPPKEASEEVRNRAFLRAPDRLGFDWPVTAAILIGLAALVVLSRWLIVPAPARTGTLAVTTTPAGATVLIDGQPFGTTPLSASLTSGTHTLELQGVGETRTVPVTMTPGAHLEQYIELARHAAPARVPETGWLTLRTPLALDVYNGNRLVGNTGSGRLTLPVGPHVLTVRNDRFGFRRTLSVGILAGKSTLADVEVPSGRVIVHALPWAEITVDGRIVGEASAASGFWIPIGTHEIVLRHPELGEQRHQINVLSSNVVRLAVDLRRP
ncbi:MAG: PEGA domain-containing protein, partial [Vicinamibacterales bacterium]